MSKKFIYQDSKSGDELIDLIRRLGGTVFVDPCPPNPFVERLGGILTKIFK